MKKPLFPNLLFLAAATLFASCQTETPTPPAPPPTPDQVIATSIVQYYGGEVTSNYYLIMTDCVLNEKGDLTTAGIIYRIDLYSTLPLDTANWRPAVGTYNFVEAGDKVNTFNPEFSNTTPVIETNGAFVEDEAEMHPLTGGSVTITHEGANGFVAVVDITLFDGTAVRFIAKNFERVDQSQASDSELDQTTFKQDVDLALGAKFARAWYSGGENNIHCWNISTDDDVTDYVFNMEIFTTSTSITEIPVGTYTASSGSEANTFTSGSFENISGTPTVYFDYDTGDYASIIKGTIIITKEANGNYKLDIDTFDELDNNFKGSWTGPVQVGPAPQQAPRAVQLQSKTNVHLKKLHIR